MRSVLFDTSVYIQTLQAGHDRILSLRRLASGSSVWLSSVVLEERYAGAKPRDSRVLERLQHDFERAGRILVPNAKDWAITGRVLTQVARKYGYEQIGRGRLTNDALIVTSAARRGITIITANERDFARLAEFQTFQWVNQTSS